MATAIVHSGVPQDLRYEEVPLYEFLVRSAAAHPDWPALTFYDRSLTYEALLDEVQRFAAGLDHLGLKKGDRVGIMLPNCPQVVIAYYGVLWAGGVVVMINPLYKAHELQVQLVDSGARMLIALDQFDARIEEIRGETVLERVIVTRIQERLPFPLNILYTFKLRHEGNRPKILFDGDTVRFNKLLEGEPMYVPVRVDAKEDLAVLQYTGGTTGTPKGVMLTHFNLVANCLQIDPIYPRTHDGQTTIVGVLPIFHAYAMTIVMNYGVMIGARIVLFPRFEMKRVLKAIQKYRPQLFPGVPTMYVAIANYPEVHRYDLKSVEWCISGAAPLPEQVKKAFEALTGGRLVEGYGLSEASPVTHCNPTDGTAPAGSVGLPLADTHCRIVDLDTGEPVAPGDTGELQVHGPQVMRGYWNRPEETAATLMDGWLSTGDIARVDKDGFYYIVDRKKEMVIVSGENVYPREVEEVLYQHPAVKEAAAIGVPDAYRGEAVKAFVVLKQGADASAEEIVEWCRQKLAPYKVPRNIEFETELPKSLIGKVLRRVLAEREQAREAVPVGKG